MGRRNISLLICFLFTVNLAFGQKDNPNNSGFTLVSDTLRNAHGFKIFQGKKLVCGEGSGENGWFQFISFKNPLSWPLLLWRDMEIKNNLEYQLDEGMREKDKLKQFLTPGDTLMVTKIRKKLGKDILFLKTGHGISSINFSCELSDAITFGELILPAD